MFRKTSRSKFMLHPVVSSWMHHQAVPVGYSEAQRGFCSLFGAELAVVLYRVPDMASIGCGPRRQAGRSIWAPDVGKNDTKWYYSCTQLIRDRHRLRFWQNGQICSAQLPGRCILFLINGPLSQKTARHRVVSRSKQDSRLSGTVCGLNGKAFARSAGWQ